MKTLFKAIAIASLASATAAQAELSASVAVDSEYVFRGATIDDSLTTSGTLEYTMSGFTVGAWVADIEDQETNLYVSYDFTVGDIDLGISYTDYSYDIAEDGEEEVSISASVQGFGLSYTDGSLGDFDYSVTTIDYTLSNTNILVGLVDGDDDVEWNYFEITGALGQVAGVDATLTYTGTFGESDGLIEGVNSDSIVIGLSKAFDL